MQFQITLAFEIMCTHSPVFVQDEMIYRIKPGKIGGQLQKARTCCLVHHSSCQGNFCSLQTVMRHCSLSRTEKSLKRQEVCWLRSQPGELEFLAGHFHPKSRVLEGLSRKQGRETASALQRGSSFPRSKPAPEGQPHGTECPFWNIQLLGRDLNWSHNLATCNQWLGMQRLSQSGEPEAAQTTDQQKDMTTQAREVSTLKAQISYSEKKKMHPANPSSLECRKGVTISTGS